MMERAKGIEPSYAAWEAAVLPLNYAREGRDFPGFDTFTMFPQAVRSLVAALSLGYCAEGRQRAERRRSRR
ncbi:protein of unknown function [Hyphomicrobium sp. MC1]|nr:protein of unknown function [Hyphomicrobium sp. MC1]